MAGGVVTILSTVCFAVAMLCMIVSVATNRMYRVESQNVITAGSVTVTIATESNIGLFKNCITVGDETKCEAYDFAQMAQAPTALGCERKEADIKNRIMASRAMSILAILMALGALGSSAAAMTDKLRVLRFASLGTGILGALMSAIGMGIFAHTIDSWLYCDKSFCDAFPMIEPCSNEFGYSFGLGCGCLILSLVGTILGAIALRSTAANEESKDPVNPDARDREQRGVVNGVVCEAAPAKGGVYEAEHQPTTERKTADEAPVEKKPKKQGRPSRGEHDIPDGDWEWDDESGMYWSDEQYMYWDCHSNHYYDTNSGYWYNPDTEEWYEA